MREIKFRAWHKEYKAMIPWKLFVELFEGLKIGVTDRMIHKVNDFSGEVERELSPFANYKDYRGINIFEHPDFEIMQYTGLKDKNGKEVFEGDIICKNPNFKFTVVWKDNWAKFCLYANFLVKGAVKKTAFMSIQQVQRMEIIGNIYENPELL